MALKLYMLLSKPILDQELDGKPSYNNIYQMIHFQSLIILHHLFNRSNLILDQYY